MKVTLEGALKSHNSNPFKLIQPEDLKAENNTRKYQISTDNIACTSDQIAMSKQETPSSRIDFYSTEDFSAKKQYSTWMTSERKPKKQIIINKNNLLKSYNGIKFKEACNKLAKQKEVILRTEKSTESKNDSSWISPNKLKSKGNSQFLSVLI